MKPKALPKPVPFLLAVIISLSSRAQLAKLTYADEQKFRMNLSKSVVLVTPFSKNIRSVTLGDVVPYKVDSFVRFTVLKANAGSTKQGPYVHFMKLDKRLVIKSEAETFLLEDGSASLEPIAAFETGSTLNLITASADKNVANLQFAYWSFNLADFSLTKRAVPLANLAFGKDKQYDFRLQRTDDEKRFGLTVFEEGSRKEAPVLHCLAFNNDLSLDYKRSVTLPFVGKNGELVNTLMTNDGTVSVLINQPHPDRDEIKTSSLLLLTKSKEQIVPLTHKGEPLVRCAVGLNSAGQTVIGGLTWPSKKGNTTGLVVGKIAPASGLGVLMEEALEESLLKTLDNADGKGLKAGYSVRSVSERENGTLDVVLNYCTFDMGSVTRFEMGGSSTRSSAETVISDAVVLSYNAGKRTATIPIKRNLRYNTQYNIHVVNEQLFSIPQVFSQNNTLYLLYYDNPANAIGETEKPKWADFKHGSLALAKIDAANKPSRQELILFGEDQNFDDFYRLMVNRVDAKRFMLTANKYKLFSKDVKTSSILLDVK